MEEKDLRNLNTVALAYIGDAVYEVDVRKRLIEAGLSNVNHLHRESVKYVSAKAQAGIIRVMFDELSESEQALVKRARNHRVNTKAKNADMITYKWATAFEALLGYMYLAGMTERYAQLVSRAFEIVEGGEEHE